MIHYRKVRADFASVCDFFEVREGNCGGSVTDQRDWEERKYELLRERIPQADAEKAGRLMLRYLSTSPAPKWAEKLEGEFPEAAAKAGELQRQELEALTADEGLLELLGFSDQVWSEDPDGRYEELNSRLEALEEEIQDQDMERVVRRGLSESDDRVQLVAAMMALHRNLYDLTPTLLAHVVEGRPHAPQAAVFAALMERDATRDVLARFLVDSIYDDTPEEDLDKVAMRRAIVAARALLPLIGSPAPEVEYVDDDARETARKVRLAFEVLG